MRIVKMVCCAFVVVGTMVSVVASDVSEITGKGKEAALKEGVTRSGQYKVKTFPAELKDLPSISVPRGNYNAPGTGYSFKLAKAATVYLFVDLRDKGQQLDGWEKTALPASWMANGREYKDTVYKKECAAGTVEVPKNSKHSIPNLAVIKAK